MTDFCYSRPMMQRVLRQAHLMDRMMQCVGIEPVRAARIDKGEAWYEARSRCIACVHDRRCREWIAERRGTPQPVPPAFCESAEFFRLAKQATNREQMEEHHEPTLANMGTTLSTRHALSPDVERA